ncbi:MAG: RHS repeat domain-containing protein [Microcoleus sp.]
MVFLPDRTSLSNSDADIFNSTVKKDDILGLQGADKLPKNLGNSFLVGSQSSNILDSQEIPKIVDDKNNDSLLLSDSSSNIFARKPETAVDNLASVDITGLNSPQKIASQASESVVIDKLTGGSIAASQINLQTPAAPIFESVKPITVIAGDELELPLIATDPNGDRVTFSIDANSPKFPGKLEGSGKLVFQPSPAQVGTYKFTLVATDGELKTFQTVTLNIIPDPNPKTRLSGIVQNTDKEPLRGVPIELGNLTTVTGPDGSFNFEFNGAFPSDTIKVRGEKLQGVVAYPFVAEKLPLMLGREAFNGTKNDIKRPIYLPQLDLKSNTQTTNAAGDITVTNNSLGAAVQVKAGTLQSQEGGAFTGQLSISQVPTELTPAALPENLTPGLVVTIQPAESRFLTPAPLSLPNTNNLKPGTITDLWSINPATGLFDNVGKGKVSDDGKTIATIEGGIRNSSWHFFAPPENPNDPSKNPNNEKDSKSCPLPATSEVELHSGAVLETHDLVPYQSQGASRGLTLQYDSMRAYPQPIVHFGYDTVPPNPALKLIAQMSVKSKDFEYQVPGYSGNEFGLKGGENFWSIPAGSPTSGINIDAALQADLSFLPSGQYEYELKTGLRQLTDNRFTGAIATSKDKLVVVNSMNSPFGSGWGIAGLQELTGNEDGSVLLIDGNGTEVLFKPPTAAGEAYVAPAGDFSKLERLSNGTFRRTMTDQTVYSFNAALKLASVRDRIGNETRYLYDNTNRLTQVVDPVGLATTLTYSGTKVSQMTDPAGRVTQMEYDKDGNLIKITDPDGSQRNWEYSSKHLMTAETDKRGNREQDIYDFAGRVDKAIQKNGKTIDVTPVQVQGLYRPEATIDPTKAPPVQTVDAKATTVKAEYVDANGNAITNILDQRGQVIASADKVGQLPTVERSDKNLVTKQTDAKGNISEFSYDDRGNLLTAKDNLSKTSKDSQGRVFTYDSKFNRVTSVTDELGHKVLYDIDPANGNVRSITQVVGEVGGNDDLVTRFTYTQQGLVDIITNPLGSVTDNDYDTQGRLIRTVFAKGKPEQAVQQFEYNQAGNLTASIDENGNRTEYQYNAMNQPVLVRDALGNTTSFSYDKTGNLVTTQDAKGNVTQNEYDKLNRLRKTVDPNQKASLFTYDAVGNVVSIVDPLGNETKNVYDARNRMVQTIDPNKGNTGFSYDANNNLTGVSDPVGNGTLFSYDVRDRLTSEVKDSRYDLSKWQTLTTTNPVDKTEFPPNWQLTGGGKNVNQSTNATPTFFVSDFDAINREFFAQISTNSSADDDWIGMVFGLKTEGGAGTGVAPQNGQSGAGTGAPPLQGGKPDSYYVLTWKQREQDIFGKAEEGIKLLKVTGAAKVADADIASQLRAGQNTANVQVLASKVGQGTGWQDNAQYGFSLNYQANGQIEIKINDASGKEINKISVTDRNPLGAGKVGFYNRSQPNVSYVGSAKPFGNSIQYEYDLANNLAAKTDRNERRTEFNYDDLNRLTAETWVGNDQTINYSYDKVGNLTATKDKFSSLAFGYDGRDRVTSVNNAGTPNTPNVLLNYAYDGVGNVRAVADNINGGGVNLYAYDPLNRMTAISQSGNGVKDDKLVSFGYNQVGQLASINRYADVTGKSLVMGTNYTYDALNRLTSMTNGNATVAPNSYSLSYDDGSRINQISNQDGATNYSYDKNGQLVAANSSNPVKPAEAYAYDANGNRIAANTGVSNRRNLQYETDPQNQLRSDGQFSYAYDNEGNLIRKTEIATGKLQEYQWDYRNRLVAVVDKAAGGQETQRVEFTYDAFDRRITKKVGDKITDFVYDGQDVYADFVDNDGNGGTSPVLDRRYLHGPGTDQVLAQEDANGKVLWDLTDHLGSVSDLVDNSGAVQNHIIYDSFGNVLSQSNPDASSRYLFTGREFDRETGLQFNRARYYDPGTGKFLSEDPIGFDGGDANLYGYVQNSSVNTTDPTGKTALAIPLLALAAVAIVGIRTVVALGEAIKGFSKLGKIIGEAIDNATAFESYDENLHDEITSGASCSSSGPISGGSSTPYQDTASVNALPPLDPNEEEKKNNDRNKSDSLINKQINAKNKDLFERSRKAGELDAADKARRFGWGWGGFL